MAVTKKANVIIPEVLADYVEEKLGDKSVFAPIADINDDLENKGEGDTLSLPKYEYVGAAQDVGEGQQIPVVNLQAGKVDKTVKKIGLGIPVTDEALLSVFGDIVEETATQLAASIDDKSDNDFLAELEAISGARKLIITGDMSSDVLIDALEIFGEDEQGVKALYLNPKSVKALRKDPDYINGSDIATDIAIKGASGELWGCQFINTNRLKNKDEAFIVKPGALMFIRQRGVMVEPERSAGTQTTTWYGSKIGVPYLADESKAAMIEKRSSVKAVDVCTSVAGEATNGTILTVPVAPINCKWVYKLGSTDVTPTWGTAVTSYTDLVSGQEIAASTNTKASVVLVFADDDKPIDYQNVTLVKKA